MTVVENPSIVTGAVAIVDTPPVGQVPVLPASSTFRLCPSVKSSIVAFCGYDNDSARTCAALEEILRSKTRRGPRQGPA